MSVPRMEICGVELEIVAPVPQPLSCMIVPGEMGGIWVKLALQSFSCYPRRVHRRAVGSEQEPASARMCCCSRAHSFSIFWRVFGV